MSNPYSGLPAERYWRTGVADAHPFTVKNLYQKKFDIRANDRIAVAGSCFAQHVAVQMRHRGYKVLDTEPAPAGMSDATAHAFSYRTYSARYGNVYTVRQLLQLLQDAASGTVRDEDVWEKNGRFFDALRPGVEPGGLATPDEVRLHRESHLKRVHALFRAADVFVFTLGLTECFMRKDTGTVYPTCPGVIAGEFDPAVYEFKNFGFEEIKKDLDLVYRKLKARKPEMRFLLTVSPVPLTATATMQHILSATTYSKSVLRAVCGTMSDSHEDVDYFPSYELIASPFSRGFFYEPNLRSVTLGGVEVVMRNFFDQHRLETQDAIQRAAPRETGNGTDEGDALICEERLLEAFS